MLEDPVDARIQQAGERSIALDRALSALAHEYAEQDSPRRLFIDQSRKTVSRYAEQLRGDQSEHSRVLSTGSELTDRLAESAVRKQALADGGIHHDVNAALDAQPRPGTFGRAETDHDLNVAAPSESTTSLVQIIATPWGRVGDPGRSGPTNDILGRDAATELLARLVPGAGSHALGQLAPVTPIHRGLEPGEELATALADTLARHETPGPMDLGTNRGSFPFDSSHDRGDHQGFPSPELDSHAAEADNIIRADLAPRRPVGCSETGAVLGGTGNVFGRGGQVSNSIDGRTTSSPDGGWNGHDGGSSATMTSSSAQEATAATVAEVERLRIAVRRTIDDLERVRGSVQPALPALPRNSGAFRIS